MLNRIMPNMPIKNFTTIESEYGKFIVNRHCSFQAEVLIKTGRPHIQEELNKVLAIINTLADNCVVVDAGANIGLLSIPIGQLIAPKNGLVHAFEPQRMMAYALSGGVALNDLENVIVHNRGLGSECAILQAPKLDYGKPQDFGLYTLLEPNENSLQRIDVVTIDSMNLERLDFLKIDVEGMEVAVLNGAKKTIERDKPWCWVEYWKVEIDDIKAQFEKLDYQFYLMDDLNMLCAPSQRLSESTVKINAKMV